MKYTFEITISGCSTNCAHCYVNGGPAAQMQYEVYKTCTLKLKSILDQIDGEISVTLGNEPFCHRDINAILSYSAETLSDYFSFQNYPVPTTGIALLEHKERDKIIENLKNVGARSFMLAVHGGEKSHDAMVTTNHAFSKLFTAADFFADNGFSLLFNLIVGLPLCSEFGQVMKTVSHYLNAEVKLTVPLYVPTFRMRKYQAHRADMDSCLHLIKRAEQYGLDTNALLNHCLEHNESTVIHTLRTNGFDYPLEKRLVVTWKFFNITQNGDLYYGNVGAHTALLGNLLTTDTETLLELISACAPNYDYTAYFPDEVFYDLEKHLIRVSPNRKNYVYSCKQDCIYALLDELGVKSAII